MKKKIIAFFILLVIACTFLFGCNLFSTNSEKDLQRVIASVGDENYYDEIKKYELVNYYASAYSQAYEQGYDLDIESLLKNMIYNRIEIQEAVNYLIVEFYRKAAVSDYITNNGFTYYEILGRSEIYDKDNIDTDDEYKNYDYKKVTVNVKADLAIKDILKPDGEVKSSQLLMMLLRVYYTNDQTVIVNKLKEIKTGVKEGSTEEYGFKDYYKDLKDSEVFSDYLTIGALNTVWESEKSGLDQIENQLRKDRGLDEIEEEETDTAIKRSVPSKDKEEPFVLPKANKQLDPEDGLRKEAFEKYKSQIKKNLFNMPYEEFYEKQLVSELEQKALELYQELWIKAYAVESTEFEEQFNAIKESEKQSFSLSLNDYKTKLQSLGDDSFILYNPDAGVYGYVKQILLGLDTDLNKNLQRELDLLKTREMSRTAYLKERNKILEKTRVKDLREDLEVGENDDRFPNYPNFSDTIYTMKEIDGDSYFYKKFKDDFGAIDKSNGIFQYDATKFADEKAMLDKFEQYIFMYNTDPGMFNNSVDYLLTELGSMGSGETYMAEFAKASRDLIKLAHDNPNDGIGYYTLTATDYGYHIIMCSDIITAGEENFDLGKFNEIADRIRNGIETPADKETAIYKLYIIIRDSKGQESFNKISEEAKNKYYRENKVTLYESRYQDLL